MKVVIWLDNIQGGGIENLQRAEIALRKIYPDFKVVGAVAPPEINFENVRRINKKNLKKWDFDMILVECEETNVLIKGDDANYVRILKDAKKLGLDVDKFVLTRVVMIPGFTLEKYNQLRRSKLSILSQICWGGLVYHRFGLPFLSPTINMYAESEENFLQFLKNLKSDVYSEPEFLKTVYEQNLKWDFPVYKIGDSVWYMNHYNNFEVAKQKWIERAQRINWDNLLVAMYTEKPEILAEFDKLPFAKKVCFVNFETELESGYYVDLSKLSAPVLWRAVDSLGRGDFDFFDMWDMLLHGKKTPLT